MTKAKVKDVDEGAEGDTSNGAGTGDDDGGDDEDTIDADELEATVRQLVEQVVGELLGDGGDGAGDGGDGSGDGSDGAGGGAPRSQVDVERVTYDAVRKAMERLHKEEATDTRLRKIEKVVEQKIREEAPRTVRRLTRLMWGADK